MISVLKINFEKATKFSLLNQHRAKPQGSFLLVSLLTITFSPQPYSHILVPSKEKRCSPKKPYIVKDIRKGLKFLKTL